MRLSLDEYKTKFFQLTLLLCAIKKVFLLECIQCDRQGVWYSPEENEKHIMRCQHGLIEPSRCANSSHTHCIYNYYKNNGVTTITERRCGTAEDIDGCTLYKSQHRRLFKRHLIGGSSVDTPILRTRSHLTRRRETGTSALLVEVCTEGCTIDGCINGSPGRTSFLTIIIIFLLFTFFLKGY